MGVIIGITIALSIIDVLTGYINAVIHNTVSSSIMRRGLAKKAANVIVVAVAALLQWGQGYLNLGINIPVVSVACAFIIWMEATSIFENCNLISGGKFTALIKQIIPKKEDDNDGEGED